LKRIASGYVAELAEVDTRDAEEIFEGGHFVRSDFDKEAGGGFGEEERRLGIGRVATDRIVDRNVLQVDFCAVSASESHFGQGNGETAFGEIVAGADEAGGDGFVYCLKSSRSGF
jgi:hypothetical protein